MERIRAHIELHGNSHMDRSQMEWLCVIGVEASVSIRTIWNWEHVARTRWIEFVMEQAIEVNGTECLNSPKSRFEKSSSGEINLHLHSLGSSVLVVAPYVPF